MKVRNQSQFSLKQLIQKKANDIVGVIYRHPSMEMDIFNEDKLELLLSKLNCENNKNIYIAGDLNFDML